MLPVHQSLDLSPRTVSIRGYNMIILYFSGFPNLFYKLKQLHKQNNVASCFGLVKPSVFSKCNPGFPGQKKCKYTVKGGLIQIQFKCYYFWNSPFAFETHIFNLFDMSLWKFKKKKKIVPNQHVIWHSCWPRPYLFIYLFILHHPETSSVSRNLNAPSTLHCTQVWDV